MSGGFFRGTSADQDTRFSNKQAKLMKSQKFAPELDHLVDMSKVKMDVVKPWIATRVTELLGFEDEVLINFIYGLLDGKDINGKEVQIQITGFMEKNTGRFMKELWGLLLSAQNNSSGVPQQFLDAKEEEIKKKKAETDRITHEIQKKKELEQEKQKKMDEEVDISKAVDDVSKPGRTHSATQSEDDKGSGQRNGLRGKNRSSRSPDSKDRSPLPARIRRSRSISKSFTNSRSYSEHESRSISRSPQSRGRSVSPDSRYRSPRKRSLSPRRKYSPRRPRSPLRRRSPHLRRRSSSYSWRRSPSPRRRISPSPRRRISPSPRRRRSPSPRRRRSPSPMLRISPSLRRRRSPTPVRRRSPIIARRRSPSPVRRRSPPPMRRRSPSSLRRRSPSPVRRRTPIAIRRRSPSPSRRRSQSQSQSQSPPPPPPPLPPRRRSPSPVRRRSPPRSPRQRRRSPLPSPRQKYRSGSPYHSPAYRRRRSLSREHDVRTNGVGSRRYRDDYVSERTHGRKSPAQIPEREEVEHYGQGLDPVTRQPPTSMRSPQRDPRDCSDTHRKMPVRSREVSPSQSGSSLQTGKSSPSEDMSMSEGPMRKTRDQVIRADSASPVRQRRNFSGRDDSLLTTREEGTHYSRVDGGQKTESPQRRIKLSTKAGGHRNIPTKDSLNEEYSPERVAGRQIREAEHRLDVIEMKKKVRDNKSEKAPLRIEHSLTPKNSLDVMDAVEISLPDKVRNEHPSVKQQNSPSPKRLHKSYSSEDPKVGEKKRSRSHNAVESGLDSENETKKSKDMERRKHKRHDRHHMASDDETSYDSHKDERKEAKRRRKEEKKLRKEEKRWRREERHRRKEERRTGKLKAKTMDTVALPSDVEKNRSDADDSDDHVAAKIDSPPSDTEETESEQKKLEIELRKKALESLRAKKAINP